MCASPASALDVFHPALPCLAKAAPRIPAQVHEPTTAAPVHVHDLTAVAAPAKDMSRQVPERTAEAALATAIVASGDSTPAAALGTAGATRLATAAGALSLARTVTNSASTCAGISTTEDV